MGLRFFLSLHCTECFIIPFHCPDMSEILLNGTTKLSILNYRPFPLCRLRISRYYHLRRSDFSFPTFFLYISLLRLCQKWLTWSNRYLEMIFHALDVFYIIFATVYVEVKIGARMVPYCLLRLCTCISWGANNNKNQLNWSTFFRLSN